MNNSEFADIFERIANLLEIKGEVVFKTLAYHKAAENLRSLAEDVNGLANQGRLNDIPGVGKAIAEKIRELIETGHLGFLERLEQEVPPTLLDFLEIPDVGPKKAALFWKQANITTLPELAAAAREGRLRSLPGMGEKSEARILAGIEALSRRSKRMTLGVAWPIAERWLAWLRAQPGVTRAEAAGSLRRWKTTVGDLDLVAACSQPAGLMAAFSTHPDVARVLVSGENKSSVELDNGLNVQLWVQPAGRFGTLLQFASGSKDHNVRLRELAQRKGLSLSEQWIRDADGNETLCATEEEVYAALGLPWIAPELREDRGEVQAALENRLPRLLELKDIQGDLHCHTTWSDGRSSIEEMALAAISRGLKVLAITDHSSGLAIAGGLTPERLRQQQQEILAVQQKLGDQIRLLHGAEVDIRSDGELDYPDEVLAELDLVIASLHSSLRQPREEITRRLIKAIHNPYVKIIAHPSGRLLPNREGADLDWEAVLAAVQETGVALEINAHPSRLDLDEVYARKAGEMGIRLCINTDAHSPDNLELMVYGVSVARRAWLTSQAVINTWPLEELLAWLK
jgi:DNA polymerase (family 10)